MAGTLTAPSPNVTTSTNDAAIDWRTRWHVNDLAGFAADGKKREIIDGELFVQGVPHIQHQNVCLNIATFLKANAKTGKTFINPGIVFDGENSIIPDVIWVSHERYEAIIDAESGHLTAAPELVVEVLSYGLEHERRDREVKRKLYEMRGVREYWIVDWRLKQVEVYARQNGRLRLSGTYTQDDAVTSQLLSEFSCKVNDIL
ncbi:MAG: Uma2 family endonuclease [Anaerolineae bacterium]|nr:Uma2 family endonuclease [Anaerolineae bacterium]